jgi:hypothetical protein
MNARAAFIARTTRALERARGERSTRDGLTRKMELIFAPY